ncbi:MAG: hypothetical protein FWD45_00715 [Coriobacteriia bacterium]|nr:hypothetical protein [Coriobacteriia bacterium]
MDKKNRIELGDQDDVAQQVSLVEFLKARLSTNNPDSKKSVLNYKRLVFQIALGITLLCIGNVCHKALLKQYDYKFIGTWAARAYYRQFDNTEDLDLNN